MADPSSPTGHPPSPGRRSSAGAVTVVAADEQADLAIDLDRWARLAESSLRDLGAFGELTLTFVDVEEMTELNREHMGVDGPTDVLSFPLDAADLEDLDDLDDVDTAAVTPTGDGPDHAGAPVLLGDVVICPAIAAAAAPEHAGTVDDELALLVVHGVLHVLGHDHAQPEEAAVMRAAELELLERHHWTGPAPTGFRQEQP